MPDKTATTEPAHLVTCEQIAKEWGVTRRTVRRTLDAGSVRYVQHGNHQRRFYERKAVDAYVALKTVTPRKGN